MIWPGLSDGVWDTSVYPPVLNDPGDMAPADLLMDRALIALRRDSTLQSIFIDGDAGGIMRLDLLPLVGDFGAMPKLVVVSGVIGIEEAPTNLDTEVTRIYVEVMWTQTGVEDLPLGRCGIPSVLQQVKRVLRKAQEMTVVWSGSEQQLAHQALLTTHDTLLTYEDRQGGYVFGQAIQVDYSVELTRPEPSSVAEPQIVTIAA